MNFTAETLDLAKLCWSILVSSRSIQSVEVISRAGLTLEKTGKGAPHGAGYCNGMRPGRCLFDISLGEEFYDLYGPIQYDFSEGSFASLIFPLEENFVIVTTTKNISPISMATAIAHIITRFS